MSQLAQAPKRTERGRWWAALGAALALVGVLLFHWPAAWVAASVRQLSAGRVVLLEPRGTLWQGSAHLALADGPSRVASAWSARLHWRISLAGLNQLEIHLQPQDLSEHQAWIWRAQMHPTGLELNVGDVDWLLPTAWLTGWGSPWNTVQPEGQIRLQSRLWRAQQQESHWRTEGQLTLSLLGLGTRLSSLRPLGDYQVRVWGGDTPRIELSTLQGALQMSGQGLWQHGRLRFQGEAWAEQVADEPVLSNLLSVLGNRIGPRAILKVG
ncbi:MAG: type II secretion system protein N [Alphaproteobacteria bacterium]|nr:type II secretion system protein N [Alphaproteobacteria bacterium]